MATVNFLMIRTRTGSIGDDAMTNSGDQLADSHKQEVQVETGFDYEVIDADLHVSQANTEF